MSTNGVSTQVQPAAMTRRQFPISGLLLRVLLALVISWLIVMAFFVTNVVSH